MQAWSDKMLEVLCPTCSRRLKAPEEAIGKEAKCSHCLHSFVVPTIPAPPREIVLEQVDKRPFTASKITAIGACVIAICVVVLTIGQFWPRAESLEEKRLRYARLSKKIDRISETRRKFIDQHLEWPTNTEAEKQAFRDAEYKELGITPQEVEQWYREKQALAEELALPD
jgi:hypothetical protein